MPMAIGGVEVTALSILTGLLVWYVKYTTKQTAKRENDAYIERTKREEKHDKIQKEDRDFNRGLITGTLKEIHTTGLKNAELSRESVGTLKTLCDKMNGGTKGQKAIAALKAIDERKKKTDVDVERRA